MVPRAHPCIAGLSTRTTSCGKSVRGSLDPTPHAAPEESESHGQKRPHLDEVEDATDLAVREGVLQVMSDERASTHGVIAARRAPLPEVG